MSGCSSVSARSRSKVGREFMMDAEPGMGAGRALAVVYEMFEHNTLAAVMHGVLERS